MWFAGAEVCIHVTNCDTNVCTTCVFNAIGVFLHTYWSMLYL